jgi:hypothetical protein
LHRRRCRGCDTTVLAVLADFSSLSFLTFLQPLTVSLRRNDAAQRVYILN